MDLNTKITTRPDIVAVEMDGETVMMDVETGKYYKLSGVGGAIWSLMETETTPATIIEKLLGEYDISREDCSQQTLYFIQQLIERGVVLITD